MDLSHFFERGKKEQVLSKDEMAKAIRDATVTLLHVGSFGSDKHLPAEPAKDAVTIPRLLRYSSETMRHCHTLVGVLNAPREFQIIEKEAQTGKEEQKQAGDVVHHRETIGDVYKFAHQLTSPYLNSFVQGIDRAKHRTPYLAISIIGFGDGVWETQYAFRPYVPYSIFDEEYVHGNYAIEKRSIGGLAFSWQPEKHYLVNFIFSPTPLDTNYFKRQRATASNKPYLHDRGMQQVGAFKTQKIFFDALGMAAALKATDTFDSRPETKHSKNSLEIYALEKERNREFSIVQLGKTPIGNLTYHVYSASEQPLAKETVKKPKGTAQFSFAFQGRGQT